MISNLVVMFTTCLLTAQPGGAEVLRYTRPSGDKRVLESEVTFAQTKKGTRYIGVTHRGKTMMKLSILFDKKGNVQSAETVLENAEGKKTANAKVDGKSVAIAGSSDKVQKLELNAPPVVATTAPDWSDIILTVRQYNKKKGGRQEFAGVWFHPVTKAHKRMFVVQGLGKDKLTLGKESVTLNFYRVTLRSGDYFVWADSSGVVQKLMRPGAKGGIVLSGSEKVARSLK